MTPEIEKVLDRVAKMLRLANDKGATEGERDNALRMAHATLAKHNLAIADVESRDPQRKKNSDEKRGMHTQRFYGRPWARMVASGVAELFFCEYICGTATLAKDTAHYFIGRESNAITASIIAVYVIDSITKEGRRRQRAAGAGNGYFRSFALGAALKITIRVAELKKTVPPEVTGSGKELVLASYYDTEKAANIETRDKLFPKLGRTRGTKGITDRGAFVAGSEYGGKVSLTPQVE